MVAELQGNLEQVVAQHELEQHLEQQVSAIAPEYVLINEDDLPKGCFLSRTDDGLNREYFVNCHVIERVKGVARQATKIVGRIMEGINGIAAYRLHSGIHRSFQTTYDAVAYLVSSSDYRLTDVAAAWSSLADELCERF